VVNYRKICLLLFSLIAAHSCLISVVNAQNYCDQCVEPVQQPGFGVTECLSDVSQYTSPHRLLSPVNSQTQRLGTFTGFFGVDGSKQPQDFGANANVGLAAQINYSGPLIPNRGIGFQIGSRASFTGNAVQVFELLGESKDRFQNFTTVGLFQRLDSGFSYGLAYDYVTQDSFDSFTLGQWRFRTSFDLTPADEIGVTLNFSDRNDVGQFNSETVVMDPIDQLHVYLRHTWQSGVNTSFWVGVADKHSEENAITGTLPPKTNQILFGAEFFAPLNDWMAIFGETNLVMPADTGAVDAYLGVQFAPQGIYRSRSRQNRFRTFLPVASNPTFTTDLNRR
jgi:hypothetical protein